MAPLFTLPARFARGSLISPPAEASPPRRLSHATSPSFRTMRERPILGKTSSLSIPPDDPVLQPARVGSEMTRSQALSRLSPFSGDEHETACNEARAGGGDPCRSGGMGHAPR